MVRWPGGGCVGVPGGSSASIGSAEERDKPGKSLVELSGRLLLSSERNAGDDESSSCNPSAFGAGVIVSMHGQPFWVLDALPVHQGALASVETLVQWALDQVA